ncbi:DNA-directed RNA polymerase III, subunit Rpc31 [Lipomyces japonicus]|uniref:DNA-directed RNA polymerase III, subunit Rpc31 n=1 Tax=Lipomyces japonicus TaxID=56871 RepID=UPI0034CD2DAF
MAFRGGRGGGGAGRDGGRPSFFSLDIKPDFTPTELYPKFSQPIQASLTEYERRCVSQFLQYQLDVRDSAFYVTERKKGVVEYEGGINDGIKRYSDRHLKKRRVGKTVTDHPYLMEFFPAELHGALGVASSSSSSNKPKRRRLDLAQFKASLEQAEDDVNENEENGPVGLNEEEEDELEGNDDEDEEDDFDEDEEGDYNAERYFDDGEEDYDDGGDDEAAY